MGNKKGKKDFVDQVMNFFNDDGHSKGKRPSTREKHEDARRDTGSGKPNSKSSVKYRRWKNQK